jgi:Protein of unknown function (DUF3592)
MRIGGLTSFRTLPDWWHPIFVLLCVWVFLDLMTAPRLFDSQSWLPTEAVVRDAKVERSAGKARSHNPIVRYEYKIGSTRYQGESFCLELWGSRTREEAAAIVARYPAGSSCLIYVNPANPEEAVIDRSFSLLTRILIFVCFLGWLLLGMLRIQKKECTPAPTNIVR